MCAYVCVSMYVSECTCAYPCVSVRIYVRIRCVFVRIAGGTPGIGGTTCVSVRICAYPRIRAYPCVCVRMWGTMCVSVRMCAV